VTDPFVILGLLYRRLDPSLSSQSYRRLHLPFLVNVLRVLLSRKAAPGTYACTSNLWVSLTGEMATPAPVLCPNGTFGVPPSIWHRRTSVLLVLPVTIAWMEQEQANVLLLPSVEVVRTTPPPPTRCFPLRRRPCHTSTDTLDGGRWRSVSTCMMAVRMTVDPVCWIYLS
jgi:hypothetical protein